MGEGMGCGWMKRERKETPFFGFELSSYLVGRGEGWCVEVEKSLGRSWSIRQMYDRLISLRKWDCLIGNCRKSRVWGSRRMCWDCFNQVNVHESEYRDLYITKKETLYKIDIWVLERFWHLLRDLDIFFRSSFSVAFLFSPCKLFCSLLVLYSSVTIESYRLFVHLSVMY